jgi:hypothetical protein
MTLALVIGSHYLENNVNYGVGEQKLVLFRLLDAAFVAGFQFSPVFVGVYLKTYFGTSRNAVEPVFHSEQINSCKGKAVMMMLNFSVLLTKSYLIGYFFITLLKNKFSRNSPIHREINYVDASDEDVECNWLQC